MTADRYLIDLDRAIDARAGRLAEISDWLTRRPETGFNENESSRLIGSEIEIAGLRIDPGISGLETAFRASFGSPDGLTVAVFIEYDGLPELGHANGRSLAAAATVVALQALAQHSERLPGRIVIFGSPAAEAVTQGAGAKARLLARGELAKIDAAILLQAGNAVRAAAAAAPAGQGYECRFVGHASHAAAAPERGINALEAALQTLNLVNSLRQHLRSETRIDAVLTSGGSAANIVPDLAVIRLWIRAPGPVGLRRAISRVRRSAEAAARAAGASVEMVEYTERYLNLIESPALAILAKDGWERQRESVLGGRRSALAAPTDFGNVSQAIPSVLMTFRPGIATPGTAEFRESLSTPAAVSAAVSAAKALSAAVVAILGAPEQVLQARSELAARLDRQAAFAATAED